MKRAHTRNYQARKSTLPTLSVIVIPDDIDLCIQRVDVEPDDSGSTLAALQSLVDGWIEAVPYPCDPTLTCYVNDEGKFTLLDEHGRPRVNIRATRLLEPVLPSDDYIAGPLVICGFNPTSGDTLSAPRGLEHVIAWTEHYSLSDYLAAREAVAWAERHGMTVASVEQLPHGLKVFTLDHGEEGNGTP